MIANDHATAILEMMTEHIYLYVIAIGNEGCQTLHYIREQGGCDGVKLIAVHYDANALAAAGADLEVLIDMHKLPLDNQGSLTSAARRYLTKNLGDKIANADAMFVLPEFRTLGSKQLSIAVCQMLDAFKRNNLLLAILNKPDSTEPETFREESLQALEVFDTVILLPELPRDALPNSTEYADSRYRAVSSITDLIVHQTMIGIDFADIQTVFARKGMAGFARAFAAGANYPSDAVSKALSQLEELIGPLEEVDIVTVLVNITAPGLAISDFNIVGEAVHGVSPETAIIKIGTTVDYSLAANEMAVAIFAVQNKPIVKA